MTQTVPGTNRCWGLPPASGAVVSAVLFAVAASVPAGYIVSWIGLCLWTLCVTHSRSPRTALANGGLFGAVFFGVQFDFVRTAGAPHDWFGAGPFEACWIGLVISGGLVWAANARAIHGCWRRRWPISAVLPIYIVCSEIVVDLAARWLVGTSGGLSRLALRQVDCAWLIQSADLGGELLVSWLAATVAGLMVDAFLLANVRSSRRELAFTLGVALLEIGGFVGYGTMRQRQATAEGARFVIVPCEFDSHDVSRVLELIDLAALRPICCVWPEVAIPTEVGFAASADSLLESTAHSVGCPLLVGCRRVDPVRVGPFNSAILAGAVNCGGTACDKRFLTPGMEGPLALIRWFGVGTSPEMSLLVPGEPPTVPLRLKCFSATDPARLDSNSNRSPTIGVGICHDICFPEWAAEWMRCDPAPDYLVQLANESPDWTWRAQPLLLSCARLRAVESRRSVIRSVRHGYSAVIDSNGRIAHVVDRQSHDRPLLTETVPQDLRQSWFANHGSLPSLMGVIVFALAQIAVIEWSNKHRQLASSHFGDRT